MTHKTRDNQTDRVERRHFPAIITLEERAEGDDRPAKIRGVAAVFDQLSEDLGGFREKIDRNAFDDFMKDKSRDIRALFDHDSRAILGRESAGTLSVRVTNRGLEFEVDTADTSVGRDLVTSIRRGDIAEASFGFSLRGQRSEAEEWNFEGPIPIRTLLNLDVFDVSPVAFAAYPQTTVAVRNLALAKEEADAPTQAADARARALDLLEAE